MDMTCGMHHFFTFEYDVSKIGVNGVIQRIIDVNYSGMRHTL